MNHLVPRSPFAGCALTLLLAACGTSSGGAADAPATAATVTATPGDANTPGTGHASVEAWIAGGAYKAWKSESDIHPSRSPSPHGFNRIYSNETLATAAAASDTASWPAGAAAVKELYATATDTVPVGYAVYLKLQADSADGAHWYWYERVPASSEVPHDENGVVADGYGDSGSAKAICVSCHSAAGRDMAHTPSAGGRDQVYTPVH